MSATARLYLCTRCRLQCAICSRCDRGHSYCTAECASASRREAQKRNEQRYRKTRRAQTLNAQRQQRFRLRQLAQKPKTVTHQGSDTSPTCASFQSSRQTPAPPSLASALATLGVVFCHRCGCVCEPRVRLGFLTDSDRRRVVVKEPP